MKFLFFYCCNCACKLIEESEKSFWDNKVILLILGTIVGVIGSITTTLITERLKRKQVIADGIKLIINQLEEKENYYRRKMNLIYPSYILEKELIKKGMLEGIKNILITQFESKSKAQEKISETIEGLNQMKLKQFKLD